MPSTSPFRQAHPLSDLHTRYAAVKGPRGTRDVAEEMGVSLRTLQRFERQSFVTAQTLHQIGTWTQAQERTRERGEGYGR